MDTAKGTLVGGYRVLCDVVELPSGEFTVAITTRREVPGDRGRTWPLPAPAVFSSQRDAEKHAKYLLRGIRGIKPSGEPEYTVA